MTADGASASPLVRAVAAVGLDATRLDLPTVPLDVPSWEVLLARAGYERIVGLLAHAVETGLLPSTQQQEEEVRRAHRSVLETCLLLESELLETSAVLDASDIDHLVLKGPAVAHLDYADPSLRTFADIDLLVRSEQYDDAVGTLVASGYHRRFAEIRPHFDARFGKGVSFKNPSGLETDVHRTLVMGPFGLWLDVEDMWATQEGWELGGRSFAALDRDLRFVHACYHAALGTITPRVLPLRDVAQMATRPTDRVDVARVREISRAWRGEAVIARAVVLAWDWFALEETELSEWARLVRPDHQQERALRTYLDPRMGYAARSLVALQAVRGLRNKAAYAGALAFPAKEFGSGRRHSRRARWRAGLRELVALRSRPRRR